MLLTIVADDVPYIYYLITIFKYKKIKDYIMSKYIHRLYSKNGFLYYNNKYMMYM